MSAVITMIKGSVTRLMGTKKIPAWQIVAAVIAAVLFLYFIWPTPYEYMHFEGDMYRVNRFSGVREVASENGWLSD